MAKVFTGESQMIVAQVHGGDRELWLRGWYHGSR